MVRVLAVQLDGKMLVGGKFTALGGEARNRIARLATVQAALQSLDAEGDGASVTWRRSGAGPELTLPPVLSYSNNGVTYTPLGPMMRIAGGWQRTEVPALQRQTYYLRAEGIVTGGSRSQGRIESKRQFFIDDTIFRNGFD